MKILIVNKFHWLKGGSEKYYFELGDLLKKNGHEVAYFSMEDEKNINTGEIEYFVPKIDLNNASKRKALDVIYSRQNKKIMEKALKEFEPDIVHLNNFQRQLSASIIQPIKKLKIPIVYTAHDLQAICPSITMLDRDKKVCELCLKGKYYNCLKKKCNKGSFLKSCLGMVENYFYRMTNIYSNKIDMIITPSEFYRKKYIDDGVDGSKIKTIHNFIDIKKYNVEILDEEYALYLGRLSEEKGILDLINVFGKLSKGKLVIAGDGYEKKAIEDFINDNKLQDRIRVVGFLNEEEILECMRKSKFVIVPSIWYENCPYSILESLAVGKPVIGSNKGGIPELILHEKNGYIYSNLEELRFFLKKMFENSENVKEMGEKSKEIAKERFAPEVYYKNIIKIYMDLVKGK